MMYSDNSATLNMNKRTSHIFSNAVTTAAFILIGLGVVLAYLQYTKYDPPYHVKNPIAHRAEMLDKRTLLVFREFDVSKPDINLMIERSIIQFETENTVTVVQVPDSHVVFRPGQFKMKNIYEIPALPSGDYHLINQVCWQANILRRDCLPLPVVTFHVPPEFSTND